MTKLVLVTTDGHSPDIGAPAADRLIEGRPVHRIWNVEEQGGGLYAGIWESTPGAWRVAYDEWEFCQIIEGHSILTEDGGGARHLTAGDAIVIRPGFRGIWKVVETTRKSYVIRL